MNLDYLKNINPEEISIALGVIIAGLNYLLPKKVVKKLKLDSIQIFLEFLANTKGGISIKKEID